MTVSILIPLVCIAVLMMIGCPIWIAMFAGALPYFMFLNPLHMPASISIQRLVNSMESASYLAIPYFITAGAVMNYSGISKRLFDLADGLVGHLTGGLGHVNVLLSMLMGGCSGSAAADAAMECKILVPEMEAKGYDKGFSAAVTLSSSLITPIIPPGMGLIVYAMLAEVSVGRVFAAGWIPGIATGLGMMIIVGIISKKKGYKGSRDKIAGFKELGKLFLKAFWALLIPFGLMMALRGGALTANEAGAVCAIYALFIGAFIYKELKWKHLWPILKESLIGTATTMITICGANVMSYWLSTERIPNKLAEWIINAGLGQGAFLLVVVFVLLVMGMFMNGGITILTPLLAPVAAAMGVNLVHFAIVMVFTWGIGNMSPPFGIVLYQVSSLLDMKVEDVVKSSFPFLIYMIVMALLFTFVPQISLWLPNLIYG